MLVRNKQIVFPESAMLTFITSSEISNFSIRPIHSIILSYFSIIHDVTLFIYIYIIEIVIDYKFDSYKIIKQPSPRRAAYCISHCLPPRPSQLFVFKIATNLSTPASSYFT